MIVLKCCLLLAVAGVALSEINEKQCLFQDTCERCLSVNFNCSWCSDKTYQVHYRCLTKEALLETGCAPQNIWSNEQSTSVEKDAELQDYQTDTNRATQVSPQLIRMKLVKSQTQQIQMTYRPAQNNPLDLYYLMDLTWTMRDDKDTLVQMGAKLSEALRNLTGNYRIGFGSFADKPTMPIIMPHLKENPCATEREKCEHTYSFRHRLSLTKDIDNFVQSVNGSHITANLDNLEGGLDALMQVIVCPEQVGWKEEARKIVLLVTDGFMHFAGDGLLAGASLRNDRKCHLDETGEYTESLVFDYPSLEEIYRELVRRKISVIFAVTSGVVETYKQMSSLMNGISNVEILSLDSSNILELIKTSYETFSKRAKFVDNSPPFIHLTYETNCGGQFKELRNRNYCNDLEIGKEVEFFINVTVENFPDDGIYHRTIRIEESGLSEYLELDIEIQKPCPCNEDVIDDETSRSYCKNNGVLKCGMCQCDDGWGGPVCSCNLNNGTTTYSMERECQQKFTNPVELGPVCSNRGDCECGTCYCFEGYSGKYCECPECGDYCDLDKADCVCGRCVCKHGWSGNSCNCKADVDGCKTPAGEICSDRGVCTCGGCDCEDGFGGNFCEIELGNLLANNKLCSFYESCVKCLIEQELGTYICENITNLCSNNEGERFKYKLADEDTDSNFRCVVYITDDNDVRCAHYFSYKAETKSSSFLEIKIEDCTPLDYLAMGGYIALLTLLIGLIILLIVVYCFRLADAIEYANFEKQEKFSTQMESPIYRNPVMKYEMPKIFDEDENSL